MVISNDGNMTGGKPSDTQGNVDDAKVRENAGVTTKDKQATRKSGPSDTPEHAAETQRQPQER